VVNGNAGLSVLVRQACADLYLGMKLGVGHAGSTGGKHRADRPL